MRRYAKAITAIVGGILTVLATILGTLASAFPEAATPAVVTATTFLTAAGVWWARNGHLVTEVADAVDEVPKWGPPKVEAQVLGAGAGAGADGAAATVPTIPVIVRRLDQAGRHAAEHVVTDTLTDGAAAAEEMLRRYTR